MKSIILIYIVFIASCFSQVRGQHAEFPKTQQELEQTIIRLDGEAFSYYNNCDLDNFARYFTDDLEFYHDKSGTTKTAEALMQAMRKNLCNNPDYKARRKALPATYHVYPMGNYGAVLTGDHEFYEIINGVERLTGRAKFVHLWLWEAGRWKMARVLSFDHHPAG